MEQLALTSVEQSAPHPRAARALRYGWPSLLIGCCTALLVAVALPLFASDYLVTSSTTALTYAMAALGLVVLVGRVGLISLCQVALVAAMSRRSLELSAAA